LKLSVFANEPRSVKKANSYQFDQSLGALKRA
jgi:hypothetical protein